MTESPCWHTCSIIFAVVCAIECDILFRAPVILQRLLLGILERLEMEGISPLVEMLILGL